MISTLFDCSAFDIPASVQAINDILFPVVLYVIIFWLMCNIFVNDVAEKNVPTTKYDFSVVASRIDNAQKINTEIFDVDKANKYEIESIA